LTKPSLPNTPSREPGPSRSAGLERADISILDDQFLQTFKDRPQENLPLKLLQRLVEHEIQLRRKQNITRARSFKELLEATLQKYHNRLIDAAEVVRVMIQIRQDMAAEEKRARALGLDADELAFYDAMAVNFFGLYDEAFLRDLIHGVVHTVKNNLKIDWTEPHREDVKATVRRELRRRDVRQEDLEPFLGYILDQAKEIYADWPVGGYAEVNVG